MSLCLSRRRRRGGWRSALFIAASILKVSDVMSLIRLGDLHGQVVRLARELGCRIVFSPEESNARCVWRDSGVTVYAPLIAGLTSYYVALHELGHVAIGRVSERDGGRMLCEVLAWAWALEHALVEPRAEVRREIADSLETYALAAVNMALPFEELSVALKDGVPSSVPVEHRDRYRKLWWQLHHDPAGLCRVRFQAWQDERHLERAAA